MNEFLNPGRAGIFQLRCVRSDGIARKRRAESGAAGGVVATVVSRIATLTKSVGPTPAGLVAHATMLALNTNLQRRGSRFGPMRVA